MNTITITTTEAGRIAIESPFNRDFSAQIKTIGGKWDATRKVWTVDARDEARAREILTAVYGHDGTSAGDLVTVRMSLEKFRHEQSATLGGVTVATRKSRDSAVHLASNVVLVSGKFLSRGGSRQNPRIDENNVVIEVRDIPRPVAEANADLCEIIDTTIDRDALEAEKAKLLARIAEIDALLA